MPTRGDVGVQQDHLRLPHSFGESAGATTSPQMEPLLSKKPKISSSSVLTATSLAAGTPCLVITTDSCLAFTSSIKARYFALKSPAGMVFIEFNCGPYAMVKSGF